jgi:hypothetical protein
MAFLRPAQDCVALGADLGAAFFPTPSHPSLSIGVSGYAAQAAQAAVDEKQASRYRLVATWVATRRLEALPPVAADQKTPHLRGFL